MAAATTLSAGAANVRSVAIAVALWMAVSVLISLFNAGAPYNRTAPVKPDWIHGQF
jgi:hypothetical protein